MSNIEKIRQEIERRKKICKDNITTSKSGSFPYVMEMTGYDKILDFIDHLPEEKPSEDLEEAAEKYSDKYCSDWAYRLEYEDAFIAGAEWQKEQMMKEAVVSEIVITSGGILLRDLRIEDFDYEDRAKIIIVKQ